MSGKYDRTGKQVRAIEREMRAQGSGQNPGDYVVPLVIGTALFIIIGCLVDPTSMFTLR